MCSIYIYIYTLSPFLRYERDWIFCVVITEEYNIMFDTEQLIGTAEYLTV